MGSTNERQVAARTKAEALLGREKQRSAEALKEKEKARQADADKTARLRSLRLAHEANEAALEQTRASQRSPRAKKRV